MFTRLPRMPDKLTFSLASVATSQKQVTGLRALEINEILGRVFSFLSQPTLRRFAALVCRRWRLVSGDYIERHLHWIHDDEFRDQAKDQLLALLSTARVLTYGTRTAEWTPSLIMQEVASWSLLSELCRELAHDLATSVGDIDNTNADASCLCRPRSWMIKSLCLHVEEWWEKCETMLPVLNSGIRLQDLRLDMPITAGAIPVHSVLDLCPNLLSLTISAYDRCPRGYFLPGKKATVGILENSSSENRGDTRLVRRPLRKLILDGIIVAPEVLKTYLPELVYLQELRLVSVRSKDHGTLNFWANSQFFWENLAAHCWDLERIHFNTFHFVGFEFPFALFPDVRSWGVSRDRIIGRADQFGVAQTMRKSFPCLTSLEIAPNRYLFPRTFIKQDEALHASDSLAEETLLLLENARRLQTLKIKFVPVSASAIMGGLLHRPLVWCCRDLVTLELCLASLQTTSGSGHEWHGYTFGFLGRCCPKLRHVKLKIQGDVLSLRYGLCLLIRLRDLRRLELDVVRPWSYELIPLEESDFAWIQSFDVPSRWTPSRALLRSTLRTSMSEAYGHYMKCLKRVRRILLPHDEYGPWWKDNPLFNWRRSLVRPNL